MKKIFLLSLMSAFLLVSCKKEKEEDSTIDGISPTSQYKLIDKDTTDTDLIVELFAKTTTIDMGYTPIYLKVKDFGGTTVENANVSFLPVMDMGSMEHSSPVEQPTFNSSTKMYEGMAVFTMSSDHGEWELNTIINGDT